MKKLMLFSIMLIGLLMICCEPDKVDPDKTVIAFDNTQGICAVTVYSSYIRGKENIIARISAGQLSQEFEWLPGSSMTFFFSYQINFKGISGFSINYVPELGKDQKVVRIDSNIKTTIVVPPLKETLSSLDTLLSKSSYLFIQNSSSYSLQLLRGSIIISPDNISETLVNSGERAQYTVNSSPVSNYQLAVGATNISFPDSLTSFEAGCVYNFIYSNGEFSLVSKIELILKNVIGIPTVYLVLEAPNAPIVNAGSGILTIHWTAVANAEIYEVYISTTQKPPALPVKTVYSTATVLTGLTNRTTYYVWVKAINENIVSDFSPCVRGIPWPENEVPATPGLPIIIPGINQLTITWEQPGGASSYEIYINTAPSVPFVPSVTIEKTSVIITNLENNVIYYIWVRAVNGAGKSGYSPVEASTPRLPTVAPAIPTKPVLTIGNCEIIVSWMTVELAETYEVWVGTTSNSAQAEKYGSDITGDVTETIIIGLTNETTYYVWIKAKNIIGTSGFSFPANAKPSANVQNVTPGLYLGTKKIDNYNLSSSLYYISTNAMSGDNYLIIIGADESISPMNLNYSGNTVGITLLGYNGRKNINLNSNGSMFTVNASVTLTLDNNITLVGRSTNSAPLINVFGTFIMNSGSLITGRDENKNVLTPSLDVLRATTRGTNAGEGMTDGGTEPITGGVSDYVGGGVSINNGGNFTMNGGTIYGNTASNGGGVGITGGTFSMSGGNISGNTAIYYGGGVYLINGTFNKTGGIITGYDSDTANGNVVRDSSGLSQSNMGHAVFINSSIIKRKETTAGIGVNLSFSYDTFSGGWDY